MAFYSKDSGDTNWRLFGARHFLERQRKWYVRLDHLGGGSVGVKVYAVLGDATAGNASFAAAGIAATGSVVGTFTVALADNAPITPDWDEGVSMSVVRLEQSTVPVASESAVWEVDLGQIEDRMVHAILRAMTHVQTANGYLHTVATVELGAEPTSIIPREQMPWIGIGRGFLDRTDTELGGGGGFYELILNCEAHVATDDEEAGDTNVYTLLHDVRRAVEALKDETFAGDNGRLWSVAEVRVADPERPVSWVESLGYLEFDVAIQYQLDRSAILAG